MLRYIIAATFVAVCVASVQGAQTEKREHGAHEHGSAALNIVWEGKTITLEFESPAVNIVGFEHAPRTDAQKQAVRKALVTLNNARGLFAFTPDARCSGEAKTVASELAQADASHMKSSEEHSEFCAEYRFICENPDALKAVEVNVFKLFPKTKKLRAQIVSAKGQSATELNPARARLTFP